MPPAEFTRLEGGETRTAREWLAEVEPPSGRPYVLANFIATLDGRAAIRGSTKELGSRADLEMLLELRCLADAVLVGPNTLRAEGYGELIRSPERRAHREARGLAPEPRLVTVSRSGDVPAIDGLEVFGSPREALEGARVVLCEGGPRLLRSLLAEDLVDELFLTLAPVLTGEPGAPRVVEGAALPEQRHAELRWVLCAGSELYLRFRR